MSRSQSSSVRLLRKRAIVLAKYAEEEEERRRARQRRGIKTVKRASETAEPGRGRPNPADSAVSETRSGIRAAPS